MGFPLNLFIDEDINVELICTICNEVLKNPTLIDACEHAFCDSCIKQWNETSGNATCPVDRQAIDGFLRPQRPFMNMLNSLDLHCQFKNLGCNAVVKLGDVLNHDQHCEFNPDNRKECNGGCGAVVNQAEERIHNCMAFLKDLVKARDEEIKRLKLELAETRRAGPVAAAGASQSGCRVERSRGQGHPSLFSRMPNQHPSNMDHRNRNIFGFEFDGMFGFDNVFLRNGGRRFEATTSELNRQANRCGGAAAAASTSSVSCGNRGQAAPPVPVTADEIQVCNVFNINPPMYDEMFNVVLAQLQALPRIIGVGFARDSTHCKILADMIKPAIEAIDGAQARRLRWMVQVDLYRADGIVESSGDIFTGQPRAPEARVEYNVRGLIITIMGHQC